MPIGSCLPCFELVLAIIACHLLLLDWNFLFYCWLDNTVFSFFGLNLLLKTIVSFLLSDWIVIALIAHFVVVSLWLRCLVALVHHQVVIFLLLAIMNEGVLITHRLPLYKHGQLLNQCGHVILVVLEVIREYLEQIALSTLGIVFNFYYNLCCIQRQRRWMNF